MTMRQNGGIDGGSLRRTARPARHGTSGVAGTHQYRTELIACRQQSKRHDGDHKNGNSDQHERGISAKHSRHGLYSSCKSWRFITYPMPPACLCPLRKTPEAAAPNRLLGRLRVPVVCPDIYEHELREGQAGVWHFLPTDWWMSGTLSVQCGDLCPLRIVLRDTQAGCPGRRGLCDGCAVRGSVLKRCGWMGGHQ